MGEKLFVFGLGFTGRELARQILAEGWRVAGTRRKAGDDHASEVEYIKWQTGDPWPNAANDADAWLFSMPPDDAGDPALLALQNAGFGPANFPKLRWAGYLSTTGVYGDHAGRWVFEEDALRPQSIAAERRVRAERQALATGLPMHLFRLPGIYGPGRSTLDRVRAPDARSIIKPGQVFSRIHVEDLAQGLLASIRQPNPGRIYHLCDDRPAANDQVMRFAADLLGLAPPPRIHWSEAGLIGEAARFYAENKRVSNARMKAELGVNLRFPDYEAGLRDIHRQESAH